MSLINKPFKYRQFNAVFILLALNMVVFVAQKIFGRGLSIHLSLVPAFVLQGEVWTFITYMFAHGSISHIFFNMLALYVFGTQLEAYMGSVEFLLYYLVTGVLAGAFSFGAYLFVGGWYYQLLGASGAIFAIQLAYAVFFPNNVIYFWGIFPLRAPIVVILFTAVEVFFSISGFDTGVAHLTHLAGFFFGGLFFALRYRINPLRRLFRR